MKIGSRLWWGEGVEETKRRSEDCEKNNVKIIIIVINILLV